MKETYEAARVEALLKAQLAGDTTAHRLVLEAFARIASLDRQGPCLGAVLEINPEAEAIARAMDAALAAGDVRGPLHGLPVLLKDNIDTADRLHTSAGSRALGGRYAPRDAAVAGALRAAGAVILGKANMTEFANYMAEGMPNGYSSRGGQVISPWGRQRDPSGSSTGSAVAVAAGYVPLAIGTETCGSILSPAAEAGIVGIRPTVGRISRRGILPISLSQDTPGPMARSVLCCALALDALCAGPDPEDPFTLGAGPHGGYAQAVRTAPKRLEGMRLGLISVDYEGKPVQSAAFSGALEALRALGAHLVPVTLPPFPDAAMGAVFRHEFRLCMDAALKGSAGCPGTLAGIARYNRDHAETCLRYGQSLILDALEEGAGTAHPDYLNARREIGALAGGLSRLMAAQRLEAFLSPDGSLFSVVGWPGITVPVGLDGGAPVPLVISGGALSEARLLRIARAAERAIGYGQRPPLEEAGQ